MKLHEYQAKQLLMRFGLPVAGGEVIERAEEAEAAAQRVDPTGKGPWVLKAQVHAGGRGKAGGIKLAKSLEEVRRLAAQMLGMKLVTPQTGPEGKIVRKLYITADAFYPGPSPIKEFYVSLTLDRAAERDVLIASAEGGVDIEETAAKRPEAILRLHLHPFLGLTPYQARQVAYKLGLQGEAFKNAVEFLLNLYKAYDGLDASLLEINPMLKTSDDKILALDAKLEIEDNGLAVRHRALEDWRDPQEEEPLETEARAAGLSYIKLDGNVGCMVNGAGLAMATMDMIKLAGGWPANFLDVGGGANVERIAKAFQILLKDPAVKVILVNIFGGIVQCDRVANGIVQAYRQIGTIPVPMVVRLQGTNADVAAQILRDSGLPLIPAVELWEAAQKVQEALRQTAQP
ncbi:MAG: ADP-forming succinate--CoA ligase subunit beta [Bacteroidia bacterium]|nr:ADP-forming succinate--CoA ligase subunit beta [Bacteroidia bacterium]MDW8088913.1 ADP-forming succinate--CoA ligase subunit beta [Bacteroidia bacterium]